MCVCVSHMCACVGVCDASAYCSATKSDAIQGVELFALICCEGKFCCQEKTFFPHSRQQSPHLFTLISRNCQQEGAQPHCNEATLQGGEAKKDLAEELHEYFTVDLLFFDENLLLPPWMDA